MNNTEKNRKGSPSETNQGELERKSREKEEKTEHGTGVGILKYFPSTKEDGRTKSC